MRISTNQFHNQGISSIQNYQEEVLKTQVQLSSGKRVHGPGDDPTAVAQINALKQTMSTIDQYASNGSFAKTQLVLEETAISDTVSSVQRARELAIQMSNDTYSPANRQQTAAEIDQIIQQVTNMMNYTNSEGEKIFAGSSVSVDRAFGADATNPQFFAYVGSPNSQNQDPLANYGSRFVQIGFDDDNKIDPDDQGDPSRVRITDNGQKIFGIPNGTTVYTDPVTGTPLATQPDHNILNTLVELKQQLERGEAPSDSVIDDMDSSLSNMSQSLAEIGGRQNRIQTQYESGESFKLTIEERRMELEDMDMVQGITDLTKQQNALEIAQQVFSKVQSMSLFNYIR